METINKRRGTPLSVRIATDLHQWIVAQAARADQSVTDAVERTLLLGRERQRELEWEASRSYASLRSLFDEMTEIVRANPKWLDNPAISKAVRDSFVAAIDTFFDLPLGDEQ